jgi:hypothetical protein
MIDSPHTDGNLGATGEDAWLERLLVDDALADRDAYIADAGFTARVMDQLPAPVTTLALPPWRKPALTALWATAGLGLAYALPGVVTDVAREAFKMFGARPFALSELAAAVVVVGLAAYAGAAVALRRD